jgi:hypothetical protein
MGLSCGFRGWKLRHPLFPQLAPVPARRAQGTCSALSGTFAELTEAADAGILARRAVLVLNTGAAPFLGGRQRDELWRRFQVPVFALLLDGAGQMIGYECELQSGFHLRRPAGPGAGDVVSDLCECGRPGDRLMPARRMEPKAERGVAEITAGGRRYGKLGCAT